MLLHFSHREGQRQLLPSIIIGSVSLPACRRLSCQMCLCNLPAKPCWPEPCTQEADGVCSMLQHVWNTSLLQAKVLQGQEGLVAGWTASDSSPQPVSLLGLCLQARQTCST